MMALETKVSPERAKGIEQKADDSSIIAPAEKERIAKELGFKEDNYYSAKEHMDRQMKEDGRRKWSIHMTS